MKVHDVQQGSQEWLALRAGIPTASEFDSILTRSGKKSESRERYMLTLLAERLMGRPIEEHVSMWMRRGSETESRAVSYYEFQRDMATTPVGFVTDDGETRGASPDRFVGEVGLLEIKCPSEWIHMGYLLRSGKAYDKYQVQVQGQLLVVEGRHWTDVLAFHPELPEALIRIERDEKFIRLLDEAVSEFVHELELAWAQLVEDGLATQVSRKAKYSSQDDLMRAMRESLIAIQK